MTRIYKYQRFRKYKHHIFYHILSEYYGRKNDSSNHVPEIANRRWVPCYEITHSVIRYWEIPPTTWTAKFNPWWPFLFFDFKILSLECLREYKRERLEIWSNFEHRPSYNSPTLNSDVLLQAYRLFIVRRYVGLTCRPATLLQARSQRHKLKHYVIKYYRVSHSLRNPAFL
jgi:hypothetical protein